MDTSLRFGDMRQGLFTGSAGAWNHQGPRTGSLDALLRQTEFQLALGDDDSVARRWWVWGQSDRQWFKGVPTVFGYDAAYDGDVGTTYVGVDT